MDLSINRLRRGLFLLMAYAAVITIAMVILFFKTFTATQQHGVLRVRELIIEDAAGRERILMGAPIPPAAARVRTDMAKAVKAWGKRYPNMDWYKNLDNSTNGILILDENGFDKIAIGDPTPDPNIGKRISPSTGIVINDQEGFERTGWGYFPSKGRVVLGLDSQRGQEGVTLFILEDDTTGMNINAGEKSMFLGSLPGEKMPAKVREPVFGILFNEKGKIVRKVTAQTEKSD